MRVRGAAGSYSHTAIGIDVATDRHSWLAGVEECGEDVYGVARGGRLQPGAREGCLEGHRH